MTKKKNQLTFIHIFVAIVLFVLGCTFALDKEVFHFSPEGNAKDAVISYLPKGEYALYMTYEKSPKENVIVFSGDGAMEKAFFTQEIQKGSGEVATRFVVDHGIHNVTVTTTKKEGDCLRGLDIQSTHLMNKDNYFLAALFGLGAVFVILAGLFVEHKKQVMPAVLVGIGLLASIPLFSDSIMCANGQDLLFHMVRIQGITEGFLAGEFPVRINAVQNAGFGNLSATMYPQLFLYPVAILHGLGISLMLSMKLLMVFVNVATAFICFYSVKAVTESKKIGMVTTVLYVFASYRLSNLYFRGALGETLAMVFLPLVLWGTVEVLWKDEKKWTILALGMTGVLQSHVLSVEMCALFMVLEGIVWLVKGPHKEMGRRIYYGVQAAICSVLLNASMLIPFLYYCRQDLQAFHMPFRPVESVAYLSQLFAFFIFPEGYNLEPGSTQGEMPMSVGGILLVGAVLFVVMFLLKKKEADKEENILYSIGCHSLVYGSIAIFVSSAMFPWESLGKVSLFAKLTSSLQFAWRFLSPATVFLCIVAAIGIVEFAEKKESRYVYGAVLACMLITTSWFFDQVAHNMSQISDKIYLESLDTADSIYMLSESDEFTNIHDRYKREDATPKTKYSTPAEFTEYKRKGSSLSVKVTPLSEEEDELMLPVYYYPGYEVKINGEKVDCYSLVTWVTCKMPTSEALVELKYKGFGFFVVADVVSLLSALAFIFVCVRQLGLWPSALKFKKNSSSSEQHS